MWSASHLDKQLLEILLELPWVGGNGHRADICEFGDVDHQTETIKKEQKSGGFNKRCSVFWNTTACAWQWGGLGVACLDFSSKSTKSSYIWTKDLVVPSQQFSICKQRKGICSIRIPAKPQFNLSVPEWCPVAFVQDMNINHMHTHTHTQLGLVGALTGVTSLWFSFTQITTICPKFGWRQNNLVLRL